jgi:hypothetical protein
VIGTDCTGSFKSNYHEIDVILIILTKNNIPKIYTKKTTFLLIDGQRFCNVKIF